MNMKQPGKENRRKTRYAFTSKHVPVKLADLYKGRVLDISKHGISFQLYDISLPEVIDHVLDLTVTIPKSDKKVIIPMQVIWHRFDYFGGKIVECNSEISELVQSLIVYAGR